MVLYAPDYTKLGGSHRNVKSRGMCRLHIIPRVDVTIAGDRLPYGSRGGRKDSRCVRRRLCDKVLFGDTIDIILGLEDTPPLLEIAGGQTLDGDDYGA